MRSSRVWRRQRLPESAAAEARLVSDELHALVSSLGEQPGRASDAPSQVEARLEALERGQDSLITAVGQLRVAVLEIMDGLDEARYERELAEALRASDPPDHAYRRLVRQIREVARRVLPRETSVLVVSKGDDDLLDLYRRPAAHFPQDSSGGYPGYHPRTSTAAIVQLESQRARGAEFLVLPATAFWWLDYYEAFRTHLEGRYDEVLPRDPACLIFDVRRPKPPGVLELVRQAIEGYRERFDREPAILDLQSGLDLASALPAYRVFTPPTEAPVLPYLDASVDLVVVAADGPRAEARRVASGAVVVVETASQG